jgi:uncharacterized membrane protein YecN with MAPEG domain
MITGLYAGLLGLLLVILVLRVATRRWRYKVGLGDGGINDLSKAIRVHGNFVETVPIILILMLLMELSGIPPLYMHIYGILFVFARMLHCLGLSHTENHSRGRFLGVMLSLTLITVASAALIIMNIS